MIKTLTAFAFIALNYYVYAHLGSDELIPERESFIALPRDLSNWRCPRPQEMDPTVHAILGVTDYVRCDFVNPERQAIVNLYVGYHESQVRRYGENGDETRTIHPPEHCLPGSGWNIVDSRLVPITSGSLSGTAKRFVIARGEERQLVYFWYQSRGRLIARNHEVILYKFLDRALRQRSDGSLVRFTTPIPNEDLDFADAAIRDLAATITPHFERHLPR
jgi:EpsI family protein